MGAALSAAAKSHLEAANYIRVHTRSSWLSCSVLAGGGRPNKAGAEIRVTEDVEISGQ